jgi:hypothetical protein
VQSGDEIKIIKLIIGGATEENGAFRKTWVQSENVMRKENPFTVGLRNQKFMS